MIKLLVGFSLIFVFSAFAQQNLNNNKFKQLHEELPTPNVYRTASGSPGHEYYQQQANYKINVELIDSDQIIKGTEHITYVNNSPDNLGYLWIQLDQNVRSSDSDSKLITVERMEDFRSLSSIEQKLYEFDGGFKIEYVKSSNGKSLDYYINKTMMRINLSEPLKSGASISFDIKWWYNINDRMKIGGRSGYEYFEENDNYLYTIAQFFPRMCVYNDVEGWQNKQFLGRGEFTLPFGNYDVSITVPSDHVVAATGTLQNESEVLTSEQRNRLKRANEEFDHPVLIITQEEAELAEKTKEKGLKTWRFSATNVRDFAFASSRKFMWDAQAVHIGKNKILAMSYYPKEGNPLWEKYSTQVVAHTLRVYSKYTIDYPYPVAISVHAKSIGMEYPMICFNGGRPEADGTYSERTKYGMLGVIIHEVGHNFFPMIINSDERQWTWMDEGLNTFVQYLTEQEWERNYPSRRGPAHLIADYMGGDKNYISPIMTNSESLWQFGNNAYGKPATALNILRETIMGRELFDYAFKTYCERWAFKHPTPADLFRTMEDASSVDLDWFWRGWFFTNDHVDISMKNIQHFQLNTGNPEIEKSLEQEKELDELQHIGIERNKQEIEQTMTEKYPELEDFYNKRNSYEIDQLDIIEYESLKNSISEKQYTLLNSNLNFYEIEFENIGGLVMPLILEFTFKDNSTEVIRIPAEVWKMDNYNISKVFIFDKEVLSIKLDPFLETADTDFSNNSWPEEVVPSRYKLFKESRTNENPMQRNLRLEQIKN